MIKVTYRDDMEEDFDAADFDCTEGDEFMILNLPEETVFIPMIGLRKISVAKAKTEAHTVGFTPQEDVKPVEKPTPKKKKGSEEDA